MPVEVILPQVDMDMATGKIAKWHVKEGDAVKKGALLFEIETDKAAMEIDAPATASSATSPSEGIDIPVGTAVAFLYAEGEAVAAPRIEPAGVKAVAAHAETLERATAAIERQEPRERRRNQACRGRRRSPVAWRASAGLSLSGNRAGARPRGRIQAGDVRNAPAPAQTARHPAIETRAAGGGDAIEALYQAGSYDIRPVDGMRRTIAQRLVQSKQTVPHFYLSLACDLGRLGEIREDAECRGTARQGEEACVEAVGQRFRHQGVGDSAAKGAGCQRDLGRGSHPSAPRERCRRRRGGGRRALHPRRARRRDEAAFGDLDGDAGPRGAGPFAQARACGVSRRNDGGFQSRHARHRGIHGDHQPAACDNPLAVGAGVERAVVKNGEIKIATVMSVTLSTDHRAVDGALGAELLVAFKRLIENPMGMLV